MTHTKKTETGRERLERLRREVAEIEHHAEKARAQAASVALPVAPADVFHCLTTGATIPTGQGFMSASHLTRAGENIIVTGAMIAASYNGGGVSWMALIGDDDAQVAKWGEVRFRLGPAPEDVQTWTQYGDSDWREQRQAAREDAWAQPTAQARAEALAAVEKKFGPALPTSTTFSTAPDPSIRLAEEQRARLDASGKRFFMDVTAREAGSTR